MKARVFIDAFAECLVSLAIARTYPTMKGRCRAASVKAISDAHGPRHAAATGLMFDRLWSEAQRPRT